MFCQKCGTQNPDDSKFCNKCGNDLKPTVLQVERKGISGKLGKMGIPGFRSGKTWKMALATFVYFFIFLAIISGSSDKSPNNQKLQNELSAPMQTPTINPIAATETRSAVPIYTSEPTVAPTPNPMSLSGSGDMVTKPFTLSKGMHTFTASHNGARNFIVILYDDNGNTINLILNEIGSYSGTKAMPISKTGTYTLGIQADGTWNIAIES